MSDDEECPKCGGEIRREDHSPVGGPEDYWNCTECEQEQVMFGTCNEDGVSGEDES